MCLFSLEVLFFCTQCVLRERGEWGSFSLCVWCGKREIENKPRPPVSLTPFLLSNSPSCALPAPNGQGQGEAQTSKGSLSSRATPRISPCRPTPSTGRELRSREKKSCFFLCRASANAHNCLSVFLHQVSSTFLIFLLFLTYNDALKRIVLSFACAQSWKIIDGTRAATGAVEASSFSIRFFSAALVRTCQ